MSVDQLWIPCSIRKPDNRIDDWVLVQIREADTGYLWIPKVAEYRAAKNDWYLEELGWLSDDPNSRFEVIAWMPLPEQYRGEA